jgi:hypothetical protein
MKNPSAERQRQARPRLAMILLLGHLLSSAVFVSCSLGPEQWEPQVVNLRYSAGGRRAELALDKTGPAVVIDPGEELSLLSFELRLLPTRTTGSGVRITRVKELPTVPPAALELESRVAVAMRKWEKTGPCYDTRDQALTEWAPVQAQPWELPVLQQSWILGDDWDEIRVNVYTRRGRSSKTESVYTANVVRLEPTPDHNRLQRTVRQNIFSRMMVSFRGERECASAIGGKVSAGSHEAASMTNLSRRKANEAEAWLAVALLAIGNLYIARRVALAGIPRDVVGRHSRSRAMLFLFLWALGWVVLYHAKGIELTLGQASVLALCAATSYRWNRSHYALPQPREGWGARLNQMIRPVKTIIARHDWDLSSREAAHALAATRKLHFDGADYDLLVSAESDRMSELRQRTSPISSRTASGGIAYDKECSLWIVSLARHLAGFDDYPGMVLRAEREADLEGFDRNAYQQLLWLADALLSDNKIQQS